jgi:hypothetical protein
LYRSSTIRVSEGTLYALTCCRNASARRRPADSASTSYAWHFFRLKYISRLNQPWYTPVLVIPLVRSSERHPQPGKGLSADEKKVKLLEIFHETVRAHTLCNIIQAAYTYLARRRKTSTRYVWVDPRIYAGMLIVVTAEGAREARSQDEGHRCDPRALAGLGCLTIVDPVQQSVKDVLQTLVDEELVFTDKVGSSNCALLPRAFLLKISWVAVVFWSFPSQRGVEASCFETIRARALTWQLYAGQKSSRESRERGRRASRAAR